MAETEKLNDFIRETVAADIAAGKVAPHDIVTRFPPEPNGYLHIGHAKAICLDFGIAGENGGKCNLRMDDTNPAKEDTEYVDSIVSDVRWLGFEPAGIFYASDYFERMYECAETLIREQNPGSIFRYGDNITPLRWKINAAGAIFSR